MNLHFMAAVFVFLSATGLCAKPNKQAFNCLIEANPDWSFTPVGAEHELIEATREVHGLHLEIAQAPAVDWKACNLMPVEISFGEMFATQVTFRSELSDKVIETTVPYSEIWFVTVAPFDSKLNREYTFLRLLGLEVSDEAETRNISFDWTSEGVVEIRYLSATSESGIQECDRWNYLVFLQSVRAKNLQVDGQYYQLVQMQAKHLLNAVYGPRLRGAFTTLSPCSFVARFELSDVSANEAK